MAKDPRKLIREGRKEVRKVMERNLEDISVRIIKDILKNFEKKSNAQRQTATKNIKLPVGQKYKQELKEAVAVITREAINIAKDEVPANIKFSEFDDLPPKLKQFLDGQTSLYVTSQIDDLNKKIAFTYQDELLLNNNIETVRKGMSVAASNHIQGTSVAAGAGKLVANAVNNSRKAYFDDPEVMDKIEAFQYINPEPNAAICVDLQNHVFRANDPALDQFTPPFHFNCDGWLRPIMKGSLRGRKPEKYTPTKKAQKSIQF